MFARDVTYAAAYTHKQAGGDDEIEVVLRWLTERQAETGGRILAFAPGKRNFEYSR